MSSSTHYQIGNQPIVPWADESGLTKREWLAGMALAGLTPRLQRLTNPPQTLGDNNSGRSAELIAKWAVKVADYVVSELERTALERGDDIPF